MRRAIRMGTKYRIVKECETPFSGSVHSRSSWVGMDDRDGSRIGAAPVVVALLSTVSIVSAKAQAIILLSHCICVAYLPSF